MLPVVVLAVVVGVFVLLAGSLFLWHGAATILEKRRFRPPGTLLDVGGRRVHLSLAGPAGDQTGGPAVVIETGRGHPAILWSHIATEVARTAGVVLYDRPGYGWSDPTSTPRTGRQVAAELHALLQAAGVPGPYILVGHSLGGMYVRAFAGLYPAEVAGLVLVDARHEDISLLQPPVFAEVDRKFYRLVLPLARLGVGRLIGRLKPGVFIGGPAMREKLPPALRTVADAVLLWPDLLPATAAETARFPDVSAELCACGDLGDKPLVVLTAGRQELGGWGIAGEEWERLRAIMAAGQVKLARLSSRGRQTIVADSGHNIYLEQPEVVVQAIRAVLAAVRGN